MEFIQKELESALRKAKEIKKEILFSYTERMDLPYPHAYYSSITHKNKEHFYWKDPQNDTILIGSGSVLQLKSEKVNERFQLVEEKWTNTLENASIHNPTNQPGTGPLLFGSFAFDPTNRKEPEWEAFSNAAFYLPEAMLTIKENESFLTVNVMLQPESDLSSFECWEQWKSKIININDYIVEMVPEIKNQEEIHPMEWKEAVANTISLLKKGYLNKVVLARKMKLKFNDLVLPRAVLHHLLEQQQGSYIFSFGTQNNFFSGASPERLVKKLGEDILSTCLAGSIKRSKDKETDENLGNMLMEDKKNRQEHQLVVSMIADVFHKYCKEVDIPNAPILMKTRDIQHLYTPVRGKAKEKATLLQMVESLHPTPALGGTPRDEAMKVIRDVENMDRGLYAGPIGWMDYRGNGEFIVAIRSGLIKDNEAFIYAGCGIVADSNPEDEYLETKIKFRPMLRALGGKNDE